MHSNLWNGAEDAGGTATAHCTENEKTTILKHDEIKIDSRSTCVDGSTQNRDIDHTKARPMEAKILKKSANSDIAHWLEHNRISRRCVRKGEVTNILMRMMPRETLKQTDHNLFAKIIRTKQRTIQDGRTDDGVNDPAEQNEEPPD